MQGREGKTKRANENKPSWDLRRQSRTDGKMGRIWLPWCRRSHLQAGRQAGRGSPSHPDSDESSFQRTMLTPATNLQLLIPIRQVWGENCHPGGSAGGNCAAPKGCSWLFKLFPAPPATLPEAAVSRVNLGQFKESLSGARQMMNVETITGEAPRSCLKLSSPM